jgi:HK97 family phage portal protein
MKTKAKPGRIKAALLNWLGVPISLTDEAFWSQFGVTAAGQQVNERSVLQLSAVWACARLVAETISTLPLGLYERTPSGRISADRHPLYTLIHSRPSADTTATVFWEAKIVSMLLRGNGFSEKKYIGNRLVALEFLSPARLSVSSDESGNVKYRYTEKNGKQREIPASNIFRIPGFTLDGNWGLSAIEYGAGVFGSALAASTAANSTFEKGLAPTVAFTVERIVKKEQRDEFRESIKKISGAINAGESPVLEAGMDAKTIGINPSDAQLLESRNFSVEEICRWFRVPPHMVGHTANSTSWGTGIEQQMIGFLTFTLRPWLTRIEQAINKDLLTPAEQLRYYAEFSVEGLLRADSAGRAEYESKMVNNGIMTRDEVRRLENLPPMGGNADVLTVQTALVPIDQLGNAQTVTQE